MEFLAFALVIVLTVGFAVSIARLLMGILLSTMAQQGAIRRESATASVELR